jgi:hypothetical protein
MFLLLGSWLTASLLVSLAGIRATSGWAILADHRPEEAAEHDPNAARMLWRKLPPLERLSILGRFTRQIARLRPGLFVSAALGFMLMLVLIALLNNQGDYGYVLVLSEQAVILIPCCFGALLAAQTWVVLVSRWRGDVPLLAENVRLGAALLRGPVIVVCLLYFALLAVAESLASTC